MINEHFRVTLPITSSIPSYAEFYINEFRICRLQGWTMPPRSQASSQQQANPTNIRHSQRRQTQATPPSGEFFDMDVSGSDSDSDAQPPSPSNGGQTTDEPATLAVNTVNDPMVETVAWKAAADIHFFFEKVGQAHVCRECR